MLSNRGAFGEPLDLLLVTPERETEHVGNDLAAYALRFDLRRQIEEHLVGDMREWCTNSGRRRQLRDEHRRLPHDGVDEKRRVHCEKPTRSSERRQMSRSSPAAPEEASQTVVTHID